MNMIDLGIVRYIDGNNRCTIPIEITREWGMDGNGKKPVKYYKSGDYLLLAPYYDTCLFCPERENLIQFKGKHICAACRDTILGKGK